MLPNHIATYRRHTFCTYNLENYLIRCSPSYLSEYSIGRSIERAFRCTYRTLKRSRTNNVSAKISGLSYPWNQLTRGAAYISTLSVVTLTYTQTRRLFKINCHVYAAKLTFAITQQLSNVVIVGANRRMSSAYNITYKLDSGLHKAARSSI